MCRKAQISQNSGDDPWDLVAYQEDGDSGEPSGDDPVQAVMTQSKRR